MVKAPVADGVTFTLIVQLPFAAIVPFENVRDVAPAAAVTVGVPQLVVVALGGVATTKLAGRGSTKLYPLIVPGFDVQGHEVWGATAMVLAEFLDILSRAKR